MTTPISPTADDREKARELLWKGATEESIAQALAAEREALVQILIERAIELRDEGAPTPAFIIDSIIADLRQRGTGG